MVASPAALVSTVVCRNNRETMEHMWAGRNRETMKHKVNAQTSRWNFR